MNRELLKGHLPVMILGLLAEEPLHGYALCQRLRGRLGNRLALGEGTIYPLLYRLERQGRIKATWEAGPQGKPRKVYRITRSGQRLIQEHQADWRLLGQLFGEILGEDWAQS